MADPGTWAGRVLIGSQNFSAARLRHNLAFGVLTAMFAVVTDAAATVAAVAR